MTVFPEDARPNFVIASLHEMWFLANYAVNYRKEDKNIWGPTPGNGILGIGAAILLFSIIDTMGSMFRGNKEFSIPIDRRNVPITKTSQHFYILNSRYFGLGLSKVDLDKIYQSIRSPLVHNSIIPAGVLLDPGEDERLPFNISITTANQKLYIVNVIPLFHLTSSALSAFQNDFKNGVIDLEKSIAYQEIMRKDVPTLFMAHEDGTLRVEIKEWILK
ncbi:MAG: hypothetical protein KC777_30230 [Cyanobacteria bacterium HKST-UBA02]|nr:hypothetical protein [Cyanobacteria bacterium HKST-UBA02]MCB0204989.1 hypothetical protein [Anaerolineae bacterium]MCB0255536.1 hypothetical protein [Anaerolineae bacterium]